MLHDVVNATVYVETTNIISSSVVVRGTTRLARHTSHLSASLMADGVQQKSTTMAILENVLPF